MESSGHHHGPDGRKNGRRRVLVYAPEKGEAEIITRGLAAISEPVLEVDVTLDEGLACRQLADCAYDAVVLGLTDPGETPDLEAILPDGIPLLLVGGAPGEWRSNGVFRVPLPLSFTLLRQTVVRALKVPEDPGSAPGLHHQAG